MGRLTIVDELEETQSQVEETVESQTSVADNLEEALQLPEKYRGKTPQQIAEMHINAEKELSRLGNELGGLRKLTDELIMRELPTGKKDEPVKRKEISTDDILANPNEIINEAIASHPEVKRAAELEKQLAQQNLQVALGKFREKHPDFEEVGNSPEFMEFVKATPGRQKMYAAAANYDLDVADELLVLFKNSLEKEKTAEAKRVVEQKRNSQLKDATLESTSTGESSRKIFRRRDLLDMQLRNPDAYRDEGFQAELMAAYREGRVK